MRWLNAGLSAAVAVWVSRLFDLDLFAAGGIFLASFVLLGFFGSGITGGLWNSGLWTTLPVRRLVGLFADAAV